MKYTHAISKRAIYQRFFFFQISLSARHEWWRRMTAPVEWIRIGVIILCPGGMCTERYLIRTCPECHWDKLFNWGPVSIVERSDGVQRSRFSAARCHAYQSQPSRKPSVKSPVYVLLYHWVFSLPVLQQSGCNNNGSEIYLPTVKLFSIFSNCIYLVSSNKNASCRVWSFFPPCFYTWYIAGVLPISSNATVFSPLSCRYCTCARDEEGSETAHVLKNCVDHLPNQGRKLGDLLSGCKWMIIVVESWRYTTMIPDYVIS